MKTTMRGRIMPLLGGIALCTLAACSAPGAESAIDEPATPPGRCDDCPSDKELAHAAATPEQLDFVRRVTVLENALTGQPLAAGNQVDLLVDGPQTHAAQIAAIAKARHHVHLITYIMTDDKIAHDYLRVFKERRAHGVTVRFMFDSVGSRTVGKEFRQALTAAGVEVREYGNVNPAKSNGRDWSLSRRHHRKILVVDGKVAFTGGINISDEYLKASDGSGNRGPAVAAGGKGTTNIGWRDTHVRIEGPGVAQFQKMFFDSWEEQGGEKIPPSDEYWPKLRRRGHDFVRGVNQQGNDLHDIAIEPLLQLTETEREQARRHAIYGSYLAAMKSARRRIWITQAYFIPNDEFIGVLTAAARRGVDVRLLVPSTSDIQAMVHASRFHYEPLLEAGARIWEYSGPMLHSKTAVVDGVWATVGSSNLDFRSFIHNDEANAIVIGHEFGTKMEQMYRDDIANAKEITREQWAKRSWSERLNQRMAVMFKYWI